MFFHKFTEKEGHRVLAVCDEEVHGDVLEGDKGNFEVKENFYGNERIGEEELLEKAGKSSIINAVGNRAVDLLAENNFFEEEKVLEIGEVKHAQMVKI